MPKVNPEILIWARETAGLSAEEACQKLGITSTKSQTAVEKLHNFEAGISNPPNSLLEIMAKKYRRSLVVFYLKEPPTKADRGTDFRKVNRQQSIEEDVNVDALIREIYSRQNILKNSLFDENEEFENYLTFVNSASINDGIIKVKEKILSIIDFSIQDFYKQTSIENAFSLLRSKVERIGIFVLLMGNLGNYLSKIDVEFFRGFSLADDIAPFIVINSNDAKGAWAFTLLHELTHVLLGQTGISSKNEDNSIEKFCDEVASEILLPEQIFNNLRVYAFGNIEDIAEEISRFASNHNVSSSMVSYRLYIDNKIAMDQWIQLNKIFIEKWNKQRRELSQQKGNGGPDYYVVAKHKLGNSLLNSVHRLMLDGSLTSEKAAKILGVNVKSVGKLIDLHSSRKYLANSRGKLL